MITKNIAIINKLGLHARAAMKLSHLAARYQSEVLIQFNERKINAKDILDVMVLAAKKGSSIELSASGNDEKEAIEALSHLINDRFGEEE